MNPIAPPGSLGLVWSGQPNAAPAALRDRFGIESTFAEGAATFAEVRVCATPDFAEPLAGVGVPMVPCGLPLLRPRLRSAVDVLQRAAGQVAQFDTVAAAEGCDALVATAAMPAGVRV